MTGTTQRARSTESSLSSSPADLFRFATPRTPERPTYGPVVARIAERMGKPLMPWQRCMVDVGLEVQSLEAGDPYPGDWAYDQVTGTVPRQAGKTVVAQPLMAHRASGGPDRYVWMTAQNGDKAHERWTIAAQTIRRDPTYAKQTTAAWARAHSILRWPKLGSYVRPFAPNDDSMHGETPDLVVVDELWAFDAEKRDAIVGAYQPGFTTKDGQAWLLSTAALPKHRDRAVWLNQTRRRGRRAVAEGRTLGMAYFESSIPDRVGALPVTKLDERSAVELVLKHHPARGHTLRERALWSALETMKFEDFLAAYGNYPGETEESGVVSGEQMIAAQSPELIPAGVEVAIAVDVDPDLREAVISACWRRDDGSGVTQVIDHRPGTRWVAPAAAGYIERHSPYRVAVNNIGPSREVADALESGGVEIFRVSGSDYSAACTRWLEQTTQNNPALRHDGHPALLDAVKAAQMHKWARGWDFRDRPDGDPITGLRATVLAMWGADHRPEPEYDPGPFRIR